MVKIMLFLLLGCGVIEPKEESKQQDATLDCEAVCTNWKKQEDNLDMLDSYDEEDSKVTNLKAGDSLNSQLSAKEEKSFPIKSRKDYIEIGRFFQTSKSFCDWHYYYRIYVDQYEVIEKVEDGCGRPKPLDYKDEYVYPELGIEFESRDHITCDCQRKENGESELPDWLEEEQEE